MGRGQPGRDGRTGRWRVTWKSTSVRIANLRDRGQRLGFGIRIDRAKQIGHQTKHQFMYVANSTRKKKQRETKIDIFLSATKPQGNEILGRAVFHDLQKNTVEWERVLGCSSGARLGADYEGRLAKCHGQG